MTADSLVHTDDDLQGDIVRALMAGEIAGVPAPAKMIETALNRIFLADDKAFKMKRAVRLPYVDFRLAEQRRKACEAEVAVNRRLGSPFYLEVTGIVRRGAGFALANAAGALEWAVVMKRFDTSKSFDRLAARGELNVETIEATAALVAAMHAKAPQSLVQGHAADYRQIILTLRRTEAAAAGAQGLSISDGLYDRLGSELTRLDPHIEDRRARGRVRRVHGDLHLGNLCLFEGKPSMFDALEFDERMATIDVLYDLAFLLMDLRHAGLHRHANAAMNRYWDETGESECGLALLPFFTALRAAIRMAVAVQDGRLAEAAAYRSLALDLLGHRPPVTLAIGGLSGSGKSSLAREVASLLPGPAGARILRSDVLRKRAAGVAFNQRLPIGDYAPTRRAEIYRDLISRVAMTRRLGVSAIADATFSTVDARDTLSSSLPSARRIWLDAPLAVRLDRIASRRGDASDADARVASTQGAPRTLGPGWLRLDATMSPADLAAKVLEAGQ